MTIKNKTLKLSFLAAALMGSLSYAQYTIIINPDKSSISFSKPQWTEIEPTLLGYEEPSKDNQYYRYDCTNWTPAPETVLVGTTFTQTATDCKGKKFAKMAKQEKNNITNEIRQTETYIDETNEQVSTNLTHTQEATGTKTDFLTIVNPVQGQSGIYQITDGKNGTFPAYVNMTDDGGNWILVARWTTSPAGAIRFNNFAVKGNPIRTYTNDPNNYPVAPNSIKNESSTMLIKSFGAGWTSMFGSWQSFSTFTPSTVIGPSGIAANTSIGPKTLYIRTNGWVGILPQDMTSTVGFMTTYGNSGPCGGANKVGSNKICIVYSDDSTSHFDIKSLKEAYIKALN